MTSYISIDWGGTNLKGIVCANGEVSEVFELPSGNIRTVQNQQLMKICQNLYQLVTELSDPPYKWLIGAAGAGNQSVINLLKVAITMAAGSTQDIEIYPDYLCNHAAALCGSDGILSVNGTGSILFGVNAEKNIRLGGWGYLFDKTPSGAYFGKKYIEAVLMGFEGHKDYEYYYNTYIGPNGEKANRHEILGQIYSSPSAQNYLGIFSKYLTEAYDANEPKAKAIIDSSIKSLSESIAYLALELELSKPKISGSGGLWDNWAPFKNLVKTACQTRGLQLEWQERNMPLVYGPLYHYYRTSGEIDINIFSNKAQK